MGTQTTREIRQAKARRRTYGTWNEARRTAALALAALMAWAPSGCGMDSRWSLHGAAKPEQAQHTVTDGSRERGGRTDARRHGATKDYSAAADEAGPAGPSPVPAPSRSLAEALAGMGAAPPEPPAATGLPRQSLVQSAPIAGRGQPGADGRTAVNGEAYPDMYFEDHGTSSLVDCDVDNLSTFAMDVDTGAYTLARGYLQRGNLPPGAAVRPEEFVNFFNYRYGSPRDEAFAIHLDGAPAPFGSSGYQLLRVGIQGRRLDAIERKDAVLTFCIDVSGSMQGDHRLGLVQRSMELLVDQLTPADRVGIVVYGSNARTVLEPTSVEDKATIVRAIRGLSTQGSTNAEEGLVLAYRMAREGFVKGAINRIVLCSDGVANVGRTGPEQILAQVKDYARKGITLSTVGVGMGNYNDQLMETLADKGDGNYAYVDSLDEARRVFVEDLTGQLQVLARDSKIQVEFNKEAVALYRLVGYENRNVADQDFRRDDVDAGEVGVGHAVTALYELKLKPDAGNGNLATVRIRYEDPDTGKVVEQQQAIGVQDLRGSFEEGPSSLRLAAAVAEFAEILKGAETARDGDLVRVFQTARAVHSEWEEGDARVQEFLDLVQTAMRLKSIELPATASTEVGMRE